MKKIISLITILAFWGCNNSTGSSITCDSSYVGIWGITATGTYENSDCSGEISSTSYDPASTFMNLNADCSLTIDDNSFCDDINDDNYSLMCTGSWSSDGNTVSIGTIFSVDYTYNNNQDILTTSLEVVQGSGDDAYDQCQYTEYTKQ